MTFVRPSEASTLAFLLIVALVIAMLAFGAAFAAGRLGHPRRRWGVATLGILLGWAGVVAILQLMGWLSPRSGMAFVGINQLLAVGLACSPFGRVLARGLPLWVLVGFHGFRLPLEMVLHSWSRQGSIPERMTWSGLNFDVVTGVLALVLGLVLLARRSRRPGRATWAAIWGFEVVGSALLVAVATIAVRNTPGPLWAYPDTAPLLLAFNFPYGWIVPFAVSAALFMHLILLRRLLGSRES